MNNIRILSWNINGAFNKLDSVWRSLQEYDIIMLSELKHGYPFSVPGFTVLRSSHALGEEHRGGVAVCVKDYLNTYIYGVESLIDQIWFRLSVFPDTIWGACYIPPCDSPFFTPVSISHIQERCFDSKAVIIGDLNSRIPELKSFSDPDLYYNINPDRHENSRGREIKQLCKDCQLYPVNNSVTKSCISEGNFTFRMKDKWVSQIDWMLCSREILEQVESFTIKQEELKLSNHAPLSISIRVPVTVSLPQLLYRASLLEEEEYYRNTTSHTKAIQMKSVNTDQFIANLPNLDHHFDGTNVNQMCASVSEMLHKTCNAATSQGNQHHAHNNSDADKWSWILAHCDSKAL